MIKLISVDIFQTLVDITPHKETLWRRFLKEDYTAPLARKGWLSATRHIFRLIKSLEHSGGFQRLESIFEKTHQNVFEELRINYPALDAARTLKEIHRQAVVFEDALPFLQEINSNFMICLSSDADNDMLARIKNIFPYNALYTSESLKTYKIWQSSKFFSTITADFDIKPDQIMHIGDAESDVNGAQRAGIKSCWLNRSGSAWPYAGQPDFSVTSLSGIITLLGAI